MAKTEHSMEDIFREALSSHEMDVSPKVWSGIESALGQAGAASAGGATGSAFLAKAAAVVGFAGLITAATIAEINYQNRVDEVVVSTADQAEAPVTENAVVLETSSPERVHSSSGDAEAEGLKKTTEMVEQVESLPAFEEAEEPSGDQKIAISDTKMDFDDAHSTSTPTVEASPANSEQESAPSEQEAAPAQQVPQNSELADQDQKNKARPSEDDVEEEEPVQASATAYFSHVAKQIITPNGDRINDYLKLDGYGVDQFMLQIATRSGHIVFETKDMNVQWNGVDRAGNALPEGVYFFQIQAVGTDGLPYMGSNSKGSVTIKR